MTEEKPDITWPQEIWAAEPGEFDVTGQYVLSNANRDRNRNFRRYIDAETYESQQRYFVAMLNNARAAKELAEAEREALLANLEKAVEALKLVYSSEKADTVLTCIDGQNAQTPAVNQIANKQDAD